MDSEQTINILLVHDDVDEANRLVSLLRNANYRVDPHYAANASELNKKVQERNWELVLAQYHATSVPAKNVIHQIRRLNKDVPVIFILGEFSFAETVEALKMGAADAVPVDEDQYLIQIVARTLAHLEQRRKLRYWKRRFSESEDRFESLILSSQDGIAIIQEGTYVHVNSAYANYFGYLDADSMTLLPVIDTIAGTSQSSFKKYLKPLDEHDAWDAEVIRFEGNRPDGNAIPVQAVLSQIDFHGEQALQLLIKKDYMASGTGEAGAGTPYVETDVSKIRLQELVEGINSTIRRAAKTGEDALLFYLEVDHYGDIQKRLGIGETEEGMAQLAHFLDSLIPDKALFGRLREEAFTFVLTTSDGEKGLAMANRLLTEVSSQIFNISHGSFTCTLSIGIATIGEATASADEVLSACQQTIAELQQVDANGKSGNRAKLYEPVFDAAASDISDAEVLRIGRHLIKKNQIGASFQPVISLHGSEDEIYEARMQLLPEGFAGGEIPDDFVTRVFNTEIGRELDRIVIEQVFDKLKAKKAVAPHTRILIHLSQGTMEDEKFIPWLQKSLETFQLSPSDVVFELREIDITRHTGHAARMLERLRNIGTGTCLTHFGLAINPMTIFNKIAVDYVKIDGVLSAKAQKDKTALAALKNLLAELTAAKHRVIVPLIESATIIPTLWQAGVDFLQGNYVQPPQDDMGFDFSEE